MSTNGSDFTVPPARGGSIPPDRGSPPPASAPEEAALMNMLRLISRLKGSATLTPVERAFVQGAKQIFEDLSGVCDKLLAADPPKNHAVPAEGETPPATPSAPKSSKQRLTTGGGQ